MTTKSRSRALVEDTRQQAGKHDLKHEGWASAGVRPIRCKLPFGDYALVPRVSVDTKQDIYELANDIDQEHERFRNEQAGASEAGCQLVILVENEDGVRSLGDLANWRESARHFQMRKAVSGNPRTRRIDGMRLAKACKTMEGRYGARFEFCAPEESWARVLEIIEEVEDEQDWGRGGGLREARAGGDSAGGAQEEAVVPARA